MLSLEEQGELERFFGPAGSSGRSTLGPMLERAEQHYTNSYGQTVGTLRYRTVMRPFDAPGAGQAAGTLVEAWPTMRTRRELGHGGIEPEDHDEDLQLAARLSRRLAQLPPATRELLRLLYGDEGCRWEQADGFGRVWALVPGTPRGRRALERDARARADKGQPPVRVTPAERLAELARARPRPGWFEGALDEAEEVQAAAEAAWGSAL